jgi:hypothetical protein
LIYLSRLECFKQIYPTETIWVTRNFLLRGLQELVSQIVILIEIFIGLSDFSVAVHCKFLNFYFSSLRIVFRMSRWKNL